jgi:hypothetical protein
MRSPGPVRIAGRKMDLATSENIFYPKEKNMADKLISIEEQEGPFKMILQRVLRMVPDRDKQDKKLQRLVAFRLKIDGEAAISEYLLKKIREAIRCSYAGSLYDFLKDDLESRECEEPNLDNDPPGAA